MNNDKRNFKYFAAILAFAAVFGVSWQINDTVKESSCVSSGQQWINGDCK